MRIRSLRDVEECEKSPLADRNLPESTYEAIRHAATLNSDNPALIFFLQGKRFRHSFRYTYRQFLTRVHQAANLFHHLGIRETGVVSYLLPNLPETLFTLWGAEATGIANPINPLLEPEQIAGIMQTAESRVLVTLAPFPGTDIWDKVEVARKSVPSLETILTVDLSPYLPRLKRTVVQAAKFRQSRTAFVQGQRVLDFNRELDSHDGEKLESPRQVRSTDIASYFHTGGTTGAPRLAMHTHGNEVANSWMAAQIAAIDPGMVALCGLPYFHVNATTLTGLAELGAGATILLGTPRGYRDPGMLTNFWRIVEHYRVRIMSGVPTVYQQLLEVPVNGIDIRSLKFPLCGAAPMPVDTFRAFEKHTGLRILEGYGLTEGTCFSSVNPVEGERRVGSIGVRIPYCEMKTVALDSQGRYVRDCVAGESGVIVIRGPYVFPGYKQALSGESPWIDSMGGDGRWLNTGDIARMDSDGYFWLTGRQKELIIRGGHNIDPAVIEQPLLEHPHVALAAAVGRPDPRVGEVPVAYVQLKSGGQVTSEELLDFLRPRIGERAALPKAVRIVDSLPLTAVGKIFKPRLSRMEIESVVAEELETIEGMEILRIEVVPDPELGSLVNVEAAPGPVADHGGLKEQIQERLSPYSFHTRCLIGGNRT